VAASSLRVVFFGTAEFAVPCLEALLQAGHRVEAVVTQPDRLQGRGLHLAASPVKVAALRLGLPVLQPRRVRSEAFIARMREMAPDVLALAAFGQIVPQALLDVPPLGPINVHGSLLPKYRGAAPIQRAIMAGEQETGVTTMWMDATLDTGDMLLSASLPIEPDDNAGTLFPKLADLGAGLLVETLAGLASGAVARRKQDESQATLAPAIQPGDGAIRWDETAEQVNNRIRGVTPRPGAFTSIRGRRTKIWRAAPADVRADAAGGTVVGFSKSPAGLLVATGGNTALLLLEAQPESGKRMAAGDWARGLRIAPGERFESAEVQQTAGE
jgi:methionyl-tRNA formyltransferase